jgi:CheY-like chemotaxis protein
VSVPVTETKRILVVEDDRDTRDLVKRWLGEDSAYEIDECYSAEDALEAARGQDFDLVMSDVMLPGINGYELIERLAPVPVLLVTVTDLEDIPRGTTAAGFLSKPFSRSGLEQAVQQALAAH